MQLQKVSKLIIHRSIDNSCRIRQVNRVNGLLRTLKSLNVPKGMLDWVHKIRILFVPGTVRRYNTDNSVLFHDILLFH